MACGGSSFGGCGSFSYIGGGSSCGSFGTSCGGSGCTISTPSASSCGPAVRCGQSGSLGSEMISRMVKPSVSEPTNFSTKKIFVYDINLDTNMVSCLREVNDNGNTSYKLKDVEIDKLRKFTKKGDYDVKELVGMSVKKDGTFKIKTKELKPYASLLKDKVPDYKEHLSHLKEVKRELKAEREMEENDYDER